MRSGSGITKKSMAKAELFFASGALTNNVSSRESGQEALVPKVWRLQEAKSKFSQVVKEALEKGPQVVTRRGEEVVVIIAKEEYDRMTRSQIVLVDCFRHSPLVGVDLDLERDQSYPRDVEP